MATAAAVAVVVGTGVSVAGQAKAASAQREAGRVSAASQKVEDASRLRQQARQARIQRARIAAAAEASGAGESSAEFGAISALQTQVASNVARVSGQQKTTEALTRLSGDVAQGRTTQALGQAITSVGSFAFSQTGGFDNLFKD